MITNWIKEQNNKTLVDLHNIVNSAKPVKKFSDRATAISRIEKITATPSYETFYKEHNKVLRDNGIRLPEPPKPVIEEKKPAAAPVAKKEKQPASPHVNLRCPHCGYFAKTLQRYMPLGRLSCPVNKAHGLLLTPEERNETRGR